MNKKQIMQILVALLVSLMALEPFVNAQTYPAGGKATISISGNGIRTGEVNLPDQLPGQFSAQVSGEGDGLQTEVTFSRSFDKPDGSATYFWVNIKAFLAPSGTFPILLVNEPNDKPYAN